MNQAEEMVMVQKTKIPVHVEVASDKASCVQLDPKWWLKKPWPDERPTSTPACKPLGRWQMKSKFVTVGGSCSAVQEPGASITKEVWAKQTLRTTSIRNEDAPQGQAVATVQVQAEKFISKNPLASPVTQKEDQVDVVQLKVLDDDPPRPKDPRPDDRSFGLDFCYERNMRLKGPKLTVVEDTLAYLSTRKMEQVVRRQSQVLNDDLIWPKDPWPEDGRVCRLKNEKDYFTSQQETNQLEVASSL
ncbi:hypothetical protein WMY93_025467 [Mugilogobius chulae]|uniref:Uncharacterized protein n=1 Tax=Mugilogobius chulae TaxID=88201 RepID=A0AAW0N6Y8_9GOBI